jgi:hypothetical protein
MPAYPPAQGDGGEGCTLGAAFFACKTKRQVIDLSGLSASSHGQKADNNKFYPRIIEYLLDNLIRSRQHIGWNS